MRVSVLGGTGVTMAGVPVDLGARKQRALVAALALHLGRPVSVDALIDLLWADAPPPGVAGTLQSYVAGLRRCLEPDRPPRAPATVLVTSPPGYALRLPADAVDAHRFEVAVGASHRVLDPLSPTVGAAAPQVATDVVADALARLDEALASWRGTPYLELDQAAGAVAERARLEELRLLALEDHAVAELALGRHATVAAELEALTASHPLRERLWGLRAVALARSGRQADALDALGRLRTLLADELGLDPGAEVRALQEAVLRQAPEVTRAPAAAPPAPAAASAGSASQEPEPAGPGEVRRTPAAWPMVGRERQLALLADLLPLAEAGTPAFAVLTGEPGIGKTRLAAELAELARRRGMQVTVGRCSQDVGAPPLWPWTRVLATLGAELPTQEHDDEGARFRTWDAVVHTLLEASVERPVLVVLDDLHWADVSSLRVLRLLVESTERGRLLVVATWRDRPEPTGALGDVAESLARQHALRLPLVGLSAPEVAQVVESVARTAPTPGQADALRSRTDGNPFFLVEYARLVADPAGVDSLLGEQELPAAVHDVVVRRLAVLPDQAATLLRLAAVVGREFDLETLSRAAGYGEEEALDRLDPALEAGLLREVGADRFLFGHALVRDAAYTALSATRRARAHARVAEVLEGLPGRETERARHWLAAGPAHAARAWPAAVTAARYAAGLHAHEEAADLLTSALTVLAQDPAASPRQQYDVLMDLLDAHRWSANWTGLVATARQAIDVARGLGEVELVARAAVSTSVGALWQSSYYGQTQTAIVAALRECRDRLPAADGELRCRVLVGLANELYYSAGFEERQALVEEALQMARRLGDDQLLLHACLTGYTALWARRTAQLRLRYSEEAIGLATRIGDERALVVSTALRAVVAGELGQVAQMRRCAAEARVHADRLRLPYSQIVLDNMLVAWLAMAGRFEECQQLLESVQRLDRQLSLPHTEDAAAGSLMVLLVWQRRAEELVPALRGLAEASPLPMTATVPQLLLRTGHRDEAAAYYAAHPVDITADDWFSTFAWASAAEIALGLGEPGLGAAAYAALAPYAGQVACAGSGAALGPVDAFLALAAAATGETGLAGRHADDALALCRTWEVPLVVEWLHDQRDRYGF